MLEATRELSPAAPKRTSRYPCWLIATTSTRLPLAGSIRSAVGPVTTNFSIVAVLVYPPVSVNVPAAKETVTSPGTNMKLSGNV